MRQRRVRGGYLAATATPEPVFDPDAAQHRVDLPRTPNDAPGLMGDRLLAVAKRFRWIRMNVELDALGARRDEPVGDPLD